MGLKREEVLAQALEAGFMLSTAHGQKPLQLMPVSDSETLMRFAEKVIRAWESRTSEGNQP